MGRPRDFEVTPDCHEMIVHMKSQGITNRLIGIEAGRILKREPLSDSWVSEYCKKRKIPTVKIIPVTDEEWAFIDEKLADPENGKEQGWSLVRIAEELGFNRNTLRNYIRDDGRFESRVPKQGQPKLPAHEILIERVAKLAAKSMPPDMIAYRIGRKPQWFFQQLGDEDDNPWKDAYTRGRAKINERVADIYMTQLDLIEKNPDKFSKTNLETVKWHDQSRLKYSATQVVEAKITDETTTVTAKERKIFTSLSERQIELIQAGLVEESFYLALEYADLLRHRQVLDKMGPQAYQNLLNGVHNGVVENYPLLQSPE